MNTGKLAVDDMVIVGEGYKSRLVRVGSISIIDVKGNDITVYANDSEALSMRGSLSRCRARLPAQFFCANRKCLVNLAEVARVDMSRRALALIMKDNMVVEVSKLQSRAFKKAYSL